ncbi:MAG: PaaI family thioesterase [Dehalococcoidia bacterium]
MPDIVEVIQARSRGTMMETIGYRVLEVDGRHALCEIDFRPELAQLTGLFHTGTLLTLADATATAACMYAVDPTGGVDPATFPLAIQLSANLVRNIGSGKAIAEARFVHKGRSTMVVETTVRDEQGRTLALVTTTHIVLAASRSAP